MINKLNDIKYVNKIYMYENSIEPNSFSKVLDEIIKDKTKDASKKVKENSSKLNLSISDKWGNTNNIALIDKINLHNNLRNFR